MCSCSTLIQFGNSRCSSLLISQLLINHLFVILQVVCTAVSRLEVGFAMVCIIILCTLNKCLSSFSRLCSLCLHLNVTVKVWTVLCQATLIRWMITRPLTLQLILLTATSSLHSHTLLREREHISLRHTNECVHFNTDVPTPLLSCSTQDLNYGPVCIWMFCLVNS